MTETTLSTDCEYMSFHVVSLRHQALIESREAYKPPVSNYVYGIGEILMTDDVRFYYPTR